MVNTVTIRRKNGTYHTLEIPVEPGNDDPLEVLEEIVIEQYIELKKAINLMKNINEYEDLSGTVRESIRKFLLENEQ